LRGSRKSGVGLLRRLRLLWSDRRFDREHQAADVLERRVVSVLLPLVLSGLHHGVDAGLHEAAGE
jgi:hypothetical protein